MEILNILVFYGLAAVSVAASVMAVTSKNIFRAVVYMLFALLGGAGLYLMLNYHFLAAAQTAIYAGGVVVLFIFAVMLTNIKKEDENRDKNEWKRKALGLLLSVGGGALTLYAILATGFNVVKHEALGGDYEMDMGDIGNALIGTGKYQYVLPFEIMGVLLLACIIGGVLIARKR